MERIEITPAPRLPRRLVGTLVALVGTVVWSHALAGLFRAIAGTQSEALASASTALTLAAVATAIAGSLAFSGRGRAALIAALAGLASAAVVGVVHSPAFIPALALVPAGAVFAAGGAWLTHRLPGTFDGLAASRPRLAVAWVLIAMVAVFQIGRLATYMTDAETDWFLSTRHPFYAKHECFSAYTYGAELNLRGEANVYDAAHYPGLNPGAEPLTEMRGMVPEDPFQYAPQFLLWPRLAMEATRDYDAIRLVWFGLNVTFCMGAVLLLSLWVGGRIGAISALLSPLVLISFPVMHNFQYGQFHFAAIALAVLSLLAFSRKYSALGGTLLAVSILSKLFPGLVLIPLAMQRRWRDLAWTAAAGAVITIVALGVLGPAPFAAFFDYHLPRLSDGSAFAFDEAWPEMAGLITAGNQGIHGIVQKLSGLGVPGMNESTAHGAGRLFALVLLTLSVLVGLRSAHATRAESAVAWLGLLGLGSLASTGAWADYVPLTCVWLLALLAPLATGRRRMQLALVGCALLQVFLLGTMPLGSLAGAAWMFPVSLLGALAMLTTFAGGVLVRAPARR